MKDEALKLALEALEDMHIVDFSLENLAGWNKAISAIKQALAAPTVQEPAALDALVKEEMRYYHDGHYLDSSDAKYQLLSFAHRISKSVRASTPPAQPSPVPLTDEEIGNILPDDDTPMSLGQAFVKFARAIEAAHGITEKGQP
jgi:hypothetical protein